MIKRVREGRGGQERVRGDVGGLEGILKLIVLVVLRVPVAVENGVVDELQVLLLLLLSPS